MTLPFLSGREGQSFLWMYVFQTYFLRNLNMVYFTLAVVTTSRELDYDVQCAEDTHKEKVCQKDSRFVEWAKNDESLVFIIIFYLYHILCLGPYRSGKRGVIKSYVIFIFSFGFEPSPQEEK